MTLSLINIQEAVENFKTLIEDSIRSGGVKAKEAMIRSSRPIGQIHQAVKSTFISNEIDPAFIFPRLNESKPEIKLSGLIKQKSQDICIFPQNINQINEVLTNGILEGIIDPYGSSYTERVISINVRSQMSSLAKNFDTLYERTIAESLNLHARCPKMVLGEVYMIPVKEYDPKAMKNNNIRFLNSYGAVEKYIKSFQTINNRINVLNEEYKYERICLLLVDFEQSPVKIFNNNDELFASGLISSNFNYNFENLSWGSFATTILSEYKSRFSD